MKAEAMMRKSAYVKYKCPTDDAEGGMSSETLLPSSFHDET